LNGSVEDEDKQTADTAVNDQSSIEEV